AECGLPAPQTRADETKSSASNFPARSSLDHQRLTAKTLALAAPDSREDMIGGPLDGVCPGLLSMLAGSYKLKSQVPVGDLQAKASQAHQ
ncbi:hypothetical protein BaRGS_00017494, partial [Batillaria attramentaria]